MRPRVIKPEDKFGGDCTAHEYRILFGNPEWKSMGRPIYMCKGKGKVVPLLLLTEHRAKKAYWRSGSTHSLTPALDGGEWSASRTGHFTPRERAPGTHWIGGWGGAQSRSGRGGEEKNSQPPPGIEP
jgi:hypothetical protein